MAFHKNNLFYGLRPKFTAEQEEFVDAIFDPDIKVIVSPSVAGTGKTQLTVGCAKILNRDLIYVFPNLCEDSFGFLPGTLFEKYYQYLGPLFDALDEMKEDITKCVYNEDTKNDPKQIDLMKRGKIWVYPKPHTFLRGRNLSGKKIIYIDEAQNFTIGELRKILSRVHDDCKVVLTGHMGQCDLIRADQSGFPAYIDFYRNCEYAKVIELNTNFRGRISRDADNIENWIKENNSKE